MGTLIDLSQLPAPQVVEPLSFEVLLQDRKTRFIQKYPEELQNEVARTLELESEPIKIAAEAQLIAYINEQHRIGRDINRSAILAALHVAGVQRVELVSPNIDIIINRYQASYCSHYQLEIGGYDE